MSLDSVAILVFPLELGQIFRKETMSKSIEQSAVVVMCTVVGMACYINSLDGPMVPYVCISSSRS